MAGGPVQSAVPTLLSRDKPIPAIPTDTRKNMMAGGPLRHFKPGPANPFSQALANINAGGSGVTTQVKNPATAAAVGGLRQDFQNSMPGAKGALTRFVQDAYARSAGASKALDQENRALDKVFSDKGLVNELATSRAKRMAAVLMRGKAAMDMAKRQNNVARMMGGNSSYLDRAYSDALAKINVGSAIENSDLERGDIQYVQGQRMGALGARDNLLRNYLSTSRIPYTAQRDFLMDNAQMTGTLAELEDRNNIYETPEQRLMREIRMAEGTDYLNNRSKL